MLAGSPSVLEGKAWASKQLEGIKSLLLQNQVSLLKQWSGIGAFSARQKYRSCQPSCSSMNDEDRDPRMDAAGQNLKQTRERFLG